MMRRDYHGQPRDIYRLYIRAVNNAERLAEALGRAADDLREGAESACRDGALCYACAALDQYETRA